jgi:hypothetical protein
MFLIQALQAFKLVDIRHSLLSPCLALNVKRGQVPYEYKPPFYTY